MTDIRLQGWERGNIATNDNEDDNYRKDADMGLFITGELLPHEITPKQWEQAYVEALQLVNAYDFLDIIRDKDKYAKYGLIWSYAETP